MQASRALCLASLIALALALPAQPSWAAGDGRMWLTGGGVPFVQPWLPLPFLSIAEDWLEIHGVIRAAPVQIRSTAPPGWDVWFEAALGPPPTSLSLSELAVRFELPAYLPLHELAAAAEDEASTGRRAREGLISDIALPVPKMLGGAGLQVSGSQKITFGGRTSYQVEQLQDPTYHQSKFPQLEMEQELRVNLKGTIGNRVNVLVDHDSERQFDEKNRIRVRYEGTEDEILQEIEAGNTSLSLGTGPQFITPSFSHQGLFGVRAMGRVGPLSLTAIASKEEGKVQTTSFTGQAKKDTIEIADTQYLHNQCFWIAPRLELGETDSVTLLELYVDRVYDEEDPTLQVEATAHTLPDDVTNPANESYDGRFSVLREGLEDDYLLNWPYDGAVYLLRKLEEGDVLAARFVSVERGSVPSEWDDEDRKLKLIKQRHLAPDKGTWDNELRNIYFLGSREINRQDLELRIKRREASGVDREDQDGVPYIRLLGLDQNSDGIVDKNVLDSKYWLLLVPHEKPFSLPTLEQTNDVIYNTKQSLLKPEDNLYYIEASYKLLQGSYTLSWSMIPNSEVVKLNGRTLTRGEDYTVESGVLTFKPGVITSPTDQIHVSYEFRPLFSASQKTLLGVRGEYPFGPSSRLGVTWMYSGERGGIRGDYPPRFGEEPRRAMVADVDGQIEFKPAVLTRFLDALPLVRTDAPSTVRLSGEVAMSMPNPNTRGRAFVDDMEGSERSEDLLGSRYYRWAYSSTPPGMNSARQDSTMIWYNFGRLDRVIRKEDIYPSHLLSHDEGNEEVTVLNLRYTPDDVWPDSSWAGLQSVLTGGGADFSEKEYLEILTKAQGVTIHIDLGAVSEDQVRRGVSNGSLDTEDQNPHDFTFDRLKEDTGYDGLFDDDEPGPGSDPAGDNYSYTESNPTYYERVNGTEGNQRWDTEDLNQNSQLDTQEEFFRITIDTESSEYLAQTYLDGWRLYRVSLDDPAVIEYGFPDWSFVEFARVWASGENDRTDNLVQLAQIGVVGNEWLREEIASIDGSVVGEDEIFEITVKSNKENAEYSPPYDPGQDEQTGYERKEQSLVLKFEGLGSEHYAQAHRSFFQEQDYSGYGALVVWARSYESEDAYTGLPASPVLVLRMGADANNYYEYRRLLDESWGSGHEIELQDLTRTKLEGTSGTLAEGLFSVHGSPSLTRVRRLSLGIHNPTGRPITGEAWVSELTLTRVRRPRGVAARVDLGTDLADLAKLDVGYERRDAEFRRLEERGTSGDRFTRASYTARADASLGKLFPIRWGISLPVNTSWSLEELTPRLATGSDVELSGEERSQQATTARRRQVGASLRKTKRSGHLLGTLLLDRVSLQGSWSRQTRASPTRIDSSVVRQATVTYDWSPTQDKVRLPLVGETVYHPTTVSFDLTARDDEAVSYTIVSGDTSLVTGRRFARTLAQSQKVGFKPWTSLSLDYSRAAVHDLTYDQEGMDLLASPDSVGEHGAGGPLPIWRVFDAREISRNQRAGLQFNPRFVRWLEPRLAYTTNYDERHTPDLLQSLEEGAADAFKYWNRTRREAGMTLSFSQLVGGAGSSRLKSVANRLRALEARFSQEDYSRFELRETRPSLAYQFGLSPGQGAYERSSSWSVDLSGGVKILTDLSANTSLRYQEDENKLQQSHGGSRNTTWPTLDVSWTGLPGALDKLLPVGDLLSGATVSSKFTRKTSVRGQVRGGSIDLEDAVETASNDWSPLASASLRWKNGLTTTVNVTAASGWTLDRGQAVEKRKNRSENSQTIGLSYSFRAPEGVEIPLLGKKVTFSSDLRLSLDVKRSSRKERYEGDAVPVSASTSFSIRPGASYNFGVVDSGLTAEYSQTTDDKLARTTRTIALHVWVLFPF
jgi:hypothetical protein